MFVCYCWLLFFPGASRYDSTNIMKQLKLTDARAISPQPKMKYAAILAEGYGKAGENLLGGKRRTRTQITALEPPLLTPRIQKKYSLI